MFDKKGRKVLNNCGAVIVTGVLEDGMFRMNIANDKSLISKEKINQCVLWYKRTEYVKYCTLEKICSGAVRGVECDLADCVSYLKDKLSRTSFKDTGTRANDILGLVH